MNTTLDRHPLSCGGPKHEVAYLTFTPNGANNVTASESHHFSSTVTHTGTGAWTAQIKGLLTKAISIMQCEAVDQDGITTYHKYETPTIDLATGTITIKHYSCSYATIVSAGPVASDTSNAITLICLVRVAS